MNMGELPEFKQKVWIELEEISQPPKDDVFKLSSFFLNPWLFEMCDEQ